MLTEKHLQEAFNLFDLDQNGEITPRELKHVLSNGAQVGESGVGDDTQDEEWEKLIEEFDQNGDG